MADNHNSKIINFQVTSAEINKKNLSLKDFEYDQNKPIGKGGFCSVYNAQYKENKKHYALKVIDKSILNNEEQIKNIINEVKIMKELDSPNLLKLVTNFEDENNIYIILPLCPNGQLYDLIHKSKKKVKFSFLKKYLYQTIQAINSLHKKQIIHRDIKPENILIDNSDNALLSDYGIATHCAPNETRNTYCGTDEYLAPEVIRGEPYSDKIDVWAIGILIYECVSSNGKTPFNKIDFLQRTENNKEFIIKSDKDLNIKYDKDFDPSAKNLISKILKMNPKQRPEISSILEHFFFDDVDLKTKNDFFNENNKKFDKNNLNIDMPKDMISKETYEKMLASLKVENEKIKNELNSQKAQLTKISNEKEMALNKNEILNQTINQYKLNLEEKNKIVDRLTNNRITQLGEGETTLPISVKNAETKSNNKFEHLLISTNEKINYIKKLNQDKNQKYFEIKDIDRIEIQGISKNSGKSEKNDINDKVDINKVVNDLKVTKKYFGDKVLEMEDSLNDMKHYLKKNDNDFKDRFLLRVKEFNNILYELKDKILASIETTMSNVNNEVCENKNKEINLLKDKIKANEEEIKKYKLECQPKIEELELEVKKWQSFSKSFEEQIAIKEKIITKLKESMKLRDVENLKQSNIIKNYESTYQ